MKCPTCNEETVICDTIQYPDQIKTIFACNSYQCPVDYIHIIILIRKDES